MCFSNVLAPLSTEKFFLVSDFGSCLNTEQHFFCDRVRFKHKARNTERYFSIFMHEILVLKTIPLPQKKKKKESKNASEELRTLKKKKKK